MSSHPLLALARGLARLVLSAVAIVSAVVFGFALVALAVYLLLWAGLP